MQLVFIGGRRRVRLREVRSQPPDTLGRPQSAGNEHVAHSPANNLFGLYETIECYSIGKIGSIV